MNDRFSNKTARAATGADVGADVKCMHCGGMTPMSDGGEVRDNEDGPLGNFDVEASSDMPGGEGEEVGSEEREKMMRYGRMLMQRGMR